MSKYIVYELWNPLCNTVFYVGYSNTTRRGMARPYDHIKQPQKQGNPFKARIVEKIQEKGLQPIVKIVFESDEKELAINEEIRLIKLYGRRDKKTGILTNLTDGGEGATNMSDAGKQKLSLMRKGKTLEEIYEPAAAAKIKQRISEKVKGELNPNYDNKWTEEKKKALSEKLMGRQGHAGTEKQRQAVINYNKSRVLTDETKIKMGAKNIGNTYCKDKPKSEEHKKKLSIARQDKTIFKWNHDIHGLVECTRTELIQMFPEQNLNSSELGKVVRGNYTHHKGWMITNLL